MSKNNVRNKTAGIVLVFLLLIFVGGLIVMFTGVQSGVQKGIPTIFVLVDEEEASQNLYKLIGFKAQILAVGSIDDESECLDPPRLTVQSQQYSISIPNKQSMLFQDKTELETEEVETFEVIEDSFDPSYFKDGIFYSLDQGCSQGAELKDIKFKMWVECHNALQCINPTTLTIGSCDSVENKCINKKYLGIIPQSTEVVQDKNLPIYVIIFLSLAIIFILLVLYYLFR